MVKDLFEKHIYEETNLILFGKNLKYSIIICIERFHRCLHFFKIELKQFLMPQKQDLAYVNNSF